MFDVYRVSSDNHQRYVIGQSGPRPLHVIGLNPSTADQNKSDTTITKIKNLSKKNNYSGFLVYNLYPLRSTNPDNLPKSPDMKMIRDNSEIIFNHISKSKQINIWAAWGQMINKRDYLAESLLDIIETLKPLNPNWLIFGDAIFKNNDIFSHFV